jgi:hypothetical protein
MLSRMDSALSMLMLTAPILICSGTLCPMMFKLSKTHHQKEAELEGETHTWMVTRLQVAGQAVAHS